MGLLWDDTGKPLPAEATGELKLLTGFFLLANIQYRSSQSLHACVAHLVRVHTLNAVIHLYLLARGRMKRRTSRAMRQIDHSIRFATMEVPAYGRIASECKGSHLGIVLDITLHGPFASIFNRHMH